MDVYIMTFNYHIKQLVIAMCNYLEVWLLSYIIYELIVQIMHPLFCTYSHCIFVYNFVLSAVFGLPSLGKEQGQSLRYHGGTNPCPEKEGIQDGTTPQKRNEFMMSTLLVPLLVPPGHALTTYYKART